MLTGTALALREIYDPAPLEDDVVEERRHSSDPFEPWVSFVHVPGAPRASRIVVRPWLAPPA
jgi:hypothetical protein